MAIANSLNAYTHTELNKYTHTNLQGTINFSVTTTVTGSRKVIGVNSSVNTSTIKFTSTTNIDAWECRATKKGSSNGVGVGLLMGGGNAVNQDVETSLNVTNSKLTLGDGEYRINVYVKLDNTWYGG